MRVVVVGGGISGLCAAHRLIEAGAPVAIDLLEASPRLGGSVWSEAIDAYPVVEHGADMFITDKPWALALCRRLGLDDELVSPRGKNRRSLVLRDGKPVEVPEGFALMAPTRVGPIVRTPLLSWRGKARLGAELLLPRRRDLGDESIAAFVRRRFGRELLDRVVQPLVGGIYTGDPEQLSLAATLPRFVELERQCRSVTLGSLRRARDAQASGARYGLFVSLERGLRALVERLAERVRARATVTLGARVTGLAREGRGWRVEHVAAGAEGVAAPSSGAIACDAVVLALPAHAAAELVRPLHAALAGDLAAIPYASTAVVVSGHALADVADPLEAFGLVVPHVERRRVLAVSFASRKLEHRAPPGSVQLRTFVGGAMQPELFELPDARIEGIVLGELRELLGVRGSPDFVRVIRHPRSMPQYLVGHLDRVAAIERQAAELPGLALCGNAYRGVGIPDCVHSGEQAADAVLALNAG